MPPSYVLVSTIEFVFDGANLSLFLTPQQCTRARARLASSSIDADCPENMDHIIRERLHVYARVPRVLGVGNPGSGSKGWTGYRTLYTTLVPSLHSPAYLTTTSGPEGSLDQAMEVHRQPRARSCSQRRPPRCRRRPLCPMTPI
ncbi:hypothetical protein EVAR_57337_1 [Eumeta japonica]|uniref:Uncharacterized protein n=1 Tax=Eumeta variegata TaxID=151549 RepID=A0A4C2A1H2_EUMVA|nr:hypothetical protein EVAR_57337_1 [Eumeta japonica]